MSLSAWLASAGPWTYLGLFALSAGESSAFLGLVLPGETFVLATGAIAAQGRLDLWWIVAMVVLGAILGDSIGYALGRRFGGCRDEGWLARFWSCERMGRVQRFFDRHGPATIFLARFVGLLRPLAPFAAGAARMPYRPFLLYNVAGGVMWGTGTVLAGYFLGAAAGPLLRSAGIWAILGLGVAGPSLLLVRRWRRRRASAQPVASTGYRGARGVPSASLDRRARTVVATSLADRGGLCRARHRLERGALRRRGRSEGLRAGPPPPRSLAPQAFPQRGRWGLGGGSGDTGSLPEAGGDGSDPGRRPGTGPGGRPRLPP
ncbi:MAG: DedA family protein [Actinobacteria bacterium]|nr:DedA family protein [Actinomycetota bacterium]